MGRKSSTAIVERPFSSKALPPAVRALARRSRRGSPAPDHTAVHVALILQLIGALRRPYRCMLAVLVNQQLGRAKMSGSEIRKPGFAVQE